jgi:hypothetical protein
MHAAKSWNRSLSWLPTSLRMRLVTRPGTEGQSIRSRQADYVVWDDAIPGFGIRIMPSGVKSALVQYRNRRTGTSPAAQRMPTTGKGPQSVNS